MKRARPILLLLTVTLLVVGFFVWFAMAPREQASESTSPEQVSMTEGTPPDAMARPDRQEASSTSAFGRNWRATVAAHDLKDPGGLLDLLGQMPAGPDRSRAIAAMISRWVAERPLALYDYLNARILAAEAGDESIDGFLRELGEALSYVDPSIAGSPDFGNILREVVRGMAFYNPEQALQWANTWLLDDALASAKVSIIAAFAKTDPTRAMELLSEVTVDIRRHEAIIQASRAMAELDPEQTQIWARSLKNELETSLAMNGLLISLSENQPERASSVLSDFANELATSHRRRVDQEKAALLADGFQRVTDELGNDLFIKGDAEVQFAALNPETELLKESIAEIAGALAARNLQTATDWARKLPDGVLRNQGLEAAIVGGIARDPSASLRALEKFFPTQSGPAESFFQVWGTENPAAAAQGLQRLTGKQQTAAIAGLAAGWIDRNEDLSAVRAWTQTLPAGDGRDRALTELVGAASLDNPEQSWVDALAIQSPELRSDALKQAFPALIRHSPDFARRAARDSRFSDEDRRRLERMLEVANN